MLFELGRYDEAETVAGPVLGDKSTWHANMWVQQTLTRIAVARGRPDEALRLVVGLAPTGSVGFADAWQAMVLAEVARAEGRFEDVVRAVDGAAEVSAGGSVFPQWLLLRVGISAAADRAVAARRRRRPGDIEVAGEHAVRWLTVLDWIVSTARSEGGAGRFLEATVATAKAEMSRLQDVPDERGWAEARDLWTEMSHPYMTSYTNLRLGEALLRTEDGRPAAETALREARKAASAIGADGLVSEIATLAGHGRLDLDANGPGADHRPIDADRRSSVSLTAREREVLRLVVEGHTNREIGDRLFISEKTVSVHVSNAMAKLGALSRYEAASRAATEGLLA